MSICIQNTPILLCHTKNNINIEMNPVSHFCREIEKASCRKIVTFFKLLKSTDCTQCNMD